MTNLIIEPSRFDRANPGQYLTGIAGNWLRSLVERYTDRYNILPYTDVRHMPLASHILTLGQQASMHVTGNNVVEGYTYSHAGIRVIPTFDAQIANDPTTKLEAQSRAEWNGDEVDDDSGDEDMRLTKDLSATRHRNWRHWIEVHVDKLFNPRPIEPKPQFITYPPLELLNNFLRTLPAGSNLYLDIETREDYGLLCIGLATDTGPVYCIPVYDYAGNLVYSNFALFWRELNLAASRTTLVIHNSMFDLVVLGKFYRFYGVKRVYDTMVAQHRIAPEAEKSLAHCIAQWTELPFHKDKFLVPQNRDQQTQLYDYNCRDVWCMRLIRAAQQAYAASRSGVASSIAAGNNMVMPFLINSLYGVYVNDTKLTAIKQQLSKECTALYRMLKILIGYDINCGSPKQLGDYLYAKCGYKVVERTNTGAPATGKKALFKLLTQTGNPALQIILRLKIVQKKLQMMEFETI